MTQKYVFMILILYDFGCWCFQLSNIIMRITVVYYEFYFWLVNSRFYDIVGQLQMESKIEIKRKFEKLTLYKVNFEFSYQTFHVTSRYVKSNLFNLFIIPIWFTFSNSLFGIFFPLTFLRNSCPNFCRLENGHWAAISTPLTSSSMLPCIARLKWKPCEGSAARQIYENLVFRVKNSLLYL